MVFGKTKGPPALDRKKPCAIVLFYQYAEPAWSETEHRRILRAMVRLGREHGITGRGRIAREDVNCTLTGESRSVRKFCQAVRALDPYFEDTDFKITDGLDSRAEFKRLTLRKTEELGATHLGAREYHTALKKPNSVVIDVRNQYETEIGRIVPPVGGAELIDPKIRNSHEFPKWLARPETQERLAGKTVLMYCTGGIRCERASALLGAASSNASAADQLLSSPKEILMVRGGIDRYLREFPDGGFWRGANYLFDKRFEQRPSRVNPTSDVVLGECASCGAKCDEYRGRYACGEASCKVPVLVCARCRRSPTSSDLRCRLCRDGYGGARKDAFPTYDPPPTTTPPPTPTSAITPPPKKKRRVVVEPPASDATRVFVGNLPLVLEKRALVDALPGCAYDVEVTWLVDRDSGLFYGSAIVDVEDASTAATIVRAECRLKKRKLRLGYFKGDAPTDPALRADRPPVVYVAHTTLCCPCAF
ncbi:hypothetical protein CTAYLR_006402 [Chrysophaeum taylorii]|uniref:Rhodanese domain-containing protein n=1 Tax=Chrysophaeum taylorii TaxID=2483200 RepID=A0AAD7XJU1_9STRA|nr:hypothetical protein CTAYLR_006402 [Chrysophaeum taylorii]